jgi:hypothetical protein
MKNNNVILKKIIIRFKQKKPDPNGPGFHINPGKGYQAKPELFLF